MVDVSVQFGFRGIKIDIDPDSLGPVLANRDLIASDIREAIERRLSPAAAVPAPSEDAPASGFLTGLKRRFERA